MNQKIKHWLIIFFLICSIFSGLLVTNLTDTTVGAEAWWNNDWGYSKKITIDHTKVAGNLTNFPILIQNTSNDFISHARSDGYDFRFVNATNESEYYFEIEEYNSTTGTLTAWVNITELSSTVDTVLYLYYGNASASTDPSNTSTWDSHYEMVQHLNETSGRHNDSTSNNVDVDPQGGLDQDAIGKIDGADDFDGDSSGDYLNNVQAFDGSKVNVGSVEAWFKAEAGQRTNARIVETGDTNDYVGIFINSNNKLNLYLVDTDVAIADIETDNTMNDAAWHYTAGIWNSTIALLYVDGSQQTDTDVGDNTLDLGSSENLFVGEYVGGGNFYFNGILDEIRISDCVRSADWINTTYNTTNSPSTFATYGNENAVTPAFPPINFLVSTLNITAINLSWSKGANATQTYIQHKIGSYPTDRSDGTNIYNDTGTNYVDTGLTSYVRHYYRAWSYNNATGNWSGSVISYNNTGPTNPTSTTGAMVGNDLNISWVMGTYADTTTIQRKTGSYPTDPTDGTNIYNDTDLYYVDTNVLQTYYYTVFSWDNDTKLYSSGVNLEWGALVVNCYDEETNESLYFDIFVFNQDGTQTYESKNNSNPLYIDVEDNLPLGEKIGIQINPAQNYSEKSETFTYPVAENSTITYVILTQVSESKSTTNVTCTNTTGGNNTYPAFTLDADVITILADATDEFDKITVNYTHNEYESRMYYRDLEAHRIYTLDAYLPNADDKELYKLIVLNQFDSPVEDAYIQIKRPVNGTYVVISSLYTDASGRVDIYLIPEEHYKVIISKSGFDTATSDFTPPQIIYAEDRTHIFRLNFELPPEEPEINIWDIITFDAYFLENDNNTLYVTYQDSSGNSTQVQIRIYQNGTDLLCNTTFPNNNSFTIGWIGANHTLYDYLVRLDIYNHSDLDDQSSNIMIPKAIPSKQQFKFDLEFDLGAILGDLGEHPVGWLNCVVFFFGVFIVVTFGKYWAGLALMALGLILGLFEIIIGLPGFTGPQFAAIAFMILFGFLVEVAKYKKTVRL